MLDPTVTDSEARCIRLLAKLFQDGETLVTFPQVALEKVGIVGLAEFEATMRMMEHFGIIRNAVHVKDDRGIKYYHHIEIAAPVMSAVRELDRRDAEAQKPGDVVSQVNERVRTNSVLAWVLIGFFILMAGATFVSQTIAILQNMGWMERPK